MLFVSCGHSEVKGEVCTVHLMMVNRAAGAGPQFDWYESGDNESFADAGETMTDVCLLLCAVCGCCLRECCRCYAYKKR